MPPGFKLYKSKGDNKLSKIYCSSSHPQLEIGTQRNLMKNSSIKARVYTNISRRLLIISLDD